MHAYIITGQSESKRTELIQALLDELGISPFDQVRLLPDPASIGVAQVREVTKTLSLKPLQSPYRALIIEQCDTMTTEAQNALLKTLEEPPAHMKIFMSVPQAHTLLQTIISRAIIRSADVPAKEQEGHRLADQITEALRGLNKGQRLLEAETRVKTKEEAQALLSELTRHTSPQHAKSILTAYKDLGGNISWRLVIDRLFLSWPTE